MSRASTRQSEQHSWISYLGHKKEAHCFAMKDYNVSPLHYNLASQLKVIQQENGDAMAEATPPISWSQLSL